MGDAPLDGKVAIVTGAGGGIGRAYARGLANAGAGVVLADVNGEAASQAAKELATDGYEALAVTTDVTSDESCAAMAASARDRFGRIDILVNNAALMAELPSDQGLMGVDLDWFDRAVRVNLRGPLQCARAVVPAMQEVGGGKIVNQTSGGAFLPSGLYGITKIGLVSMTATLAHELAPFGIRVNAIAPGFVNTDAGFRAAPPDSPMRQLIEATVPFPFGDAEDLVGALLYLVSPASDWMTGQTLNVDGGWVHRI
jgi:NAD(P)-dependent dehydrogenase (short-subunit alcohol dehydrogenase family)